MIGRGGGVAGMDSKGVSVLDGAAMVMGSAIASIHALRVMREDLTGPGWVMFWLTFAGVAITATGPFLYVGRRYARRYVRRLPSEPGIGERLWAMMGVPWLLTAVIQSATGPEPRQDPLFAATLVVGLGVTSLVAFGAVWKTWVMVTPEQAAQVEVGPWTNRIGLVLAIAWPIQCGLGLVVLN